MYDNSFFYLYILHKFNFCYNTLECLSSILITLNPLINFCARVRMKTSLAAVDFAPAKAHSHIKQPQIL